MFVIGHTNNWDTYLVEGDLPGGFWTSGLGDAQVFDTESDALTRAMQFGRYLGEAIEPQYDLVLIRIEEHGRSIVETL